MPEDVRYLEESFESEKTGRYLIAFTEDAPPDIADKMAAAAGMRIAHAAEFARSAIVPDEVGDAQMVYLDTLKVAVCNAPPTQLAFLGARTDIASSIMITEEERYVYTAESLELQRERMVEPDRGVTGSRDYLRGWRDATAHLYEQLFRGVPAAEEGEAAQAARWRDTQTLTWGLAATRADRSTFTGRGVRVAVLDTGFDFTHPDFPAARIGGQASFIPGEAVQDGNGHGTHCIGTSCGPLQPVATRRRYGVAGEAQIFVGKVLGNGGSSVDGSVLEGMNWAVENGCQIVSMSLSGRGPVSQVYETAARRALGRGSLFIAAAGNDSFRNVGVFAPVGRPANSPSVLAVAAIDAFAKVANFSNRASTAAGGEIDIAAPGVDTFSSWPVPKRYHTISGTSMATPHVAGIAALYRQQNPALTARDLWLELQRRAAALGAPSIDVGRGLVQSI